MPDPLAEPPCSEPGPPEPQALAEPSETLAGLCRRVAALEALPERVAALEALEARRARKRPVSDGRLRTRPDKTPYGWRPHPHDPGRLVEDPREEGTIFCLIELAQAPVSLRELCRRLDATGRRRRNGKKWADNGHGLVRSILRREGILTAADATAAVQQRIEAVRARAADRYCPETLSDDEARARARGRI